MGQKREYRVNALILHLNDPSLSTQNLTWFPKHCPRPFLITEPGIATRRYCFSPKEKKKKAKCEICGEGSIR